MTAIVEALRRDRASLTAWNRAASDLGIVLADASLKDVKELIDGFGRLQPAPSDEALHAVHGVLIRLLSGRAQAEESAQEQEATLVAMKQFTKKVLRALLESGGTARPTALAAKLPVERKKGRGRTKPRETSQLTVVLDHLVEDGLVEDVGVGLQGRPDLRARVCRLSARGRRLANLLPSERPQPSQSRSPTRIAERRAPAQIKALARARPPQFQRILAEPQEKSRCISTPVALHRRVMRHVFELSGP